MGEILGTIYSCWNYIPYSELDDKDEIKLDELLKFELPKVVLPNSEDTQTE